KPFFLWVLSLAFVTSLFLLLLALILTISSFLCSSLRSPPRLSPLSLSHCSTVLYLAFNKDRDGENYQDGFLHNDSLDSCALPRTSNRVADELARMANFLLMRIWSLLGEDCAPFNL
ncbi:hypothetical protein Tsubulata_033434, partial [Turnera subulata]